MNDDGKIMLEKPGTGHGSEIAAGTNLSKSPVPHLYKRKHGSKHFWPFFTIIPQ